MLLTKTKKEESRPASKDGERWSGQPRIKKVDRPERRFAAAHREEMDEERGHRFHEKRPAKMKYRENNDRKRFDKRSGAYDSKKKKKGRFYED